MNPYLFRAGIRMLAGLLTVAATYTFAATISLSGPTTDWRMVQFTSTNQFDYYSDSQAGSADLDLVGSATHPSIYTQFDDRGTVSAADDVVGFRVRLGGGDNNNDFSGVMLIGIDANLDGRLDLFLSADGRASGRSVKIWSPGAGANTSPSTTSISAPSNQKVYPFTSSNYNVSLVSPIIDPIPTLNTNLNGDARVDIFLSFAVPFDDIRAEMQRLSGLTITTGSPLRYVAITLTQNNAINGDIAGINGGINSATTYSELGVYSQITALNDTPPVFISAVADQSTSAGTAVGPLPFTVGDGQTAATNLVVVAVSSTATLVPDANLTFGGSGSNRTITVTPVPNQTGATLIQMFLSDGGFVTTTHFLVTVTNTDSMSPSVGSIVRFNPSASQINTSTVVFRVTFSEPVLNVDAADFLLTTVDAVTVGPMNVSPVNSSTYDVTVSGIGGNGTMRLDLKNDGTGITDLSANAISNGFTAGESYTVDNSAPALPSFVSITEDTGASNADFVTTDNSLIFGGATEPGASVSVLLNGTPISVTAVSELGTWTFDYSDVLLPPGSHTLTLSIIDAAGNASDTTNLTIVVDYTTPSIGGVSRHSPATAIVNSNVVAYRVQFSEPVSGVAIEDFALTTTGTAAGVIASVTQTSPSIYEVIVTGVTGDGTLRLDVPATASIMDQAGNAISGAFTAGESYTLDNILPTPPSLTRITDDTGAFANDLVTMDNTLVMSGVAEGGTTVLISINGAVTANVPTDEDGGWKFDYTTNTLADGIYSINIRAKDAAGNLSAETNVVVTIDTSISTPGVPDLAAASDSGTSALDNITSDATPTFTGTAEAGSIVTLYSGTVVIGSILATDGSWSITSTTLTNGTHVVSATAVDGAGNTSVTSETVIVTVVPGSPSISVIAAATIREDGVLGPVTVMLNDADSDPASLTVTVTSSRTDVVAEENVAVTGTGASRALTITPSANRAGTVVVTLTVRDESGQTATAEIAVTVQAENDPPRLDQTAPVFLVKNAAPTSITLSGIISGAGEDDVLAIRAASPNTNLIASVSVGYTSPETTGLLTLTLVSNTTGAATVEIVVDDGGISVTNILLVSVLDPVRITQHPESEATCSGNDTEFAVTAIGDGPLRYQWLYQGVELPNKTNATLLISEAAAFQAGSYQVRVSNPAMSVLSRPASLTLVSDNTLRIVALKVLNSDRSACLTLSGSVGQHAEIQGTFNFQQWTTLTNFTFTDNCFQFIDAQAVQNHTHRFYRLVPH